MIQKKEKRQRARLLCVQRRPLCPWSHLPYSSIHTDVRAGHKAPHTHTGQCMPQSENH